MSGWLKKNTEKRWEGLRILPIGMYLYILHVLGGRSPLFFSPSCTFSLLRLLSFFPPHLCVPSPLLAPYNTMIPAQVRCQGCDKAFSPAGLSQHMSKTQNLRCWRINNPPLDQFRTPSISCTASQYSPSLIRMPDAISDARPGDKYDGTTGDRPDDVPDLGEVSSDGASFMTHVHGQGRDALLPCIEI